MSNLHVIIPCAPHDVPFLKRCVESVTLSLNDLFLRKSLIVREAVINVIFDGAVGNPELVFETEQKARPEVRTTYTVLEKASGAAIARNVALGEAEPEDYVAFVDADDVVFPWCYWTRLNAWVDASQDGVTNPFIYTQCMHIFPDPNTKKILKVVRELPTAENIRGWLEQQNMLLTTSVLTQAKHLQAAGGFEPNMICGEDGCLWRRVVGLNGECTPVPIPLVTHSYTVRQESQCRRLHKAHQDMYHLEPPKHGPMGQALDGAAKIRGLSAKDATSVENRIAALGGPILTVGGPAQEFGFKNT